MFKICFIGILLLFSLFISGQEHPQDFHPPLDIPLVLSGTFGELRSNHFHAGIDIKTLGQSGLKVYAISDGYISRIKVSPWGYGKAIYITHDNGYSSVYAHLMRYTGAIQDYVISNQYKNQSYDIELFPTKDENTLVGYVKNVQKNGIGRKAGVQANDILLVHKGNAPLFQLTELKEMPRKFL